MTYAIISKEIKQFPDLCQNGRTVKKLMVEKK